MFKGVPIQLGQSLGNNTKTLFFSTQMADLVDESFCILKGLNTVGDIRERKCAKVFLNNVDTRICLLDIGQLLFDRSSV